MGNTAVAPDLSVARCALGEFATAIGGERAYLGIGVGARKQHGGKQDSGTKEESRARSMLPRYREAGIRAALRRERTRLVSHWTTHVAGEIENRNYDENGRKFPGIGNTFRRNS